jgi:PAS domain S-box-containing protein
VSDSTLELEKELEAERARLAAAQRAARLGSWETDLVTLQVSWSEETHRIFETDPATFHPTHQQFLEHVHPADRDAVAAAFDRSPGERGPCSVEHRILLPGDRVKYVEERWQVIFDEHGVAQRAFGTCQDVTERKLADDALRQSQALLRIAGRTAKLGGWMIKLPERTLTWSDEIALLHDLPRGYQPSLEEGLSYFPPEHHETVTRAMRACELEGVPYDLELQKYTATGRLIWVRSIGEAVRDESGAIVAMQGSLQDISEKKRLEAQFFRAQRMESIGTLAGGIAHDLNNALAPVLMAVELLRRQVRDPDGVEVLEMLESSAQRAASLVKQVLSFARGVEGKRVRVDVGAVLHEVETLVRETFPKHITFSRALPRAHESVLGDATQLVQVFTNLAVNARDAMVTPGQLSISVENVTFSRPAPELSPDAHPGKWVKVSVSDTGTGIASDVQERIFEPFFTTKETGKGTGLGLSTTQAIVRSHGGFICVESTLGRGTRFDVYLPVAVGEAVDETEPSVNPALPRGAGEVVLVVDDETPIRTVARRILERAGYRVLLATDGADALRVFREHVHEIDAVITDMNMPVMDGPSMIRQLREIDPHVLIIGSSGFAPDVASTGAGVHFIHKPYTAKGLLEALRDALSRP